MNTPNNKRRKDSQDRMINAFVKLLQEKELNKISVTDICKLAEVNRTTFYANYVDIYDLADAVQKRLEEDIARLYDYDGHHNMSKDNFHKLFVHIKENQIFYKTYFKLGVDGKFRLTEYDIQQAVEYYRNENIEYHVEFFRNGLNAVIKKWLANDCKEDPQVICDVIISEYGMKNIK